MTLHSLEVASANVQQTFTIPYIPNDPGLYDRIDAQFTNITQNYFGSLSKFASECSIDFQPLPSIVGKQSQANGGNAMDLQADQNRLVLEIQCLWQSASDDTTVHNLGQNLTDWLQTQLPNWAAAASVKNNSTDLSADEMPGLIADSPNSDTNYYPLFLNDASYDQSVLTSYRNYDKLKDLQAQIDPQGIMRTRVGGFRY